MVKSAWRGEKVSKGASREILFVVSGWVVSMGKVVRKQC
ncbi:MAG: hypothetical protein G01um101416_898 [Microgenomates group bacterium Gr01-1014_16]|nr:MAG: hypothetical protein G01um101416_898 [Microgenomates group bacterium Gr01-1014_16]